MRYASITTVTFADLAKLVGENGPVHAVEVDHCRGIVRIVHHSLKGVPEGTQLVEKFYKAEEDQ